MKINKLINYGKNNLHLLIRSIVVINDIIVINIIIPNEIIISPLLKRMAKINHDKNIIIKMNKNSNKNFNL